jgi:hypothetical protein
MAINIYITLKRTFRVFFFILHYLCLHNLGDWLGWGGVGSVLMYCSSFRNLTFLFVLILFRLLVDI